ncbi:GDSL esterase/lipase At4g10955-like isoform X5 [Camellia sinensis]|uniref:GDSL esterase/lipase At4g10955-like isoform X5 n=1 Tax=Camellia sinensis TaxID=4442 RepID=UPI001035F890|nr:GDSL esterase/lipase At4g10955-like isoform X5 [Camellia sinensis]
MANQRCRKRSKEEHMGSVIPNSEIFSISGPVYLTTTLDWANPHHRRSVAASFVKAVYTLQRDCLMKRKGPQSLAASWFESFHYKLIGYIGYFEHRLKMMELDAGEIERLATQYSIRRLLLDELGCGSEPLHLLPSAYLTINRSPSDTILRAHGIQQWWKPNIQCQSELHQFRQLTDFSSGQMFC